MSSRPGSSKGLLTQRTCTRVYTCTSMHVHVRART